MRDDVSEWWGAQGWGLQQGGRVPRRHKRTHWSRLASSVDQVRDTSNPKPVTNILTTYYALQKQQRRL